MIAVYAHSHTENKQHLGISALLEEINLGISAKIG